MIKEDTIIAEFPNERVKIKCDNCIKRGLFRKNDLIARFGSLASMKNIITALMQCPYNQDGLLPCGAKIVKENRKP